MRQPILVEKGRIFLLLAMALYFFALGPVTAASKPKKGSFESTNSNTQKLDGLQTPKLDNTEPDTGTSDAIPLAPEINSSQERVFFPPPKLNDDYNPPINNKSNILQGGVESSTTLMPPPVYNNQPPPVYNNQPPPNYMNGRVMSFQNQMQRMQGQIAPLMQQPLQGYQMQNQSMLQGNANQFNLRIERPHWIPPNAYTNDTMLAPYHNSNLFFWDKRSMPNRPQMVQLASSVTKYWRGYVPNPCFVLVEPLPAAPGNYVFTSQDRRAPRGWLQNTNQTSPSGYPLYRYWLDNPF